MPSRLTPFRTAGFSLHDHEPRPTTRDYFTQGTPLRGKLTKTAHTDKGAESVFWTKTMQGVAISNVSPEKITSVLGSPQISSKIYNGPRNSQRQTTEVLKDPRTSPIVNKVSHSRAGTGPFSAHIGAKRWVVEHKQFVARGWLIFRLCRCSEGIFVGRHKRRGVARSSDPGILFAFFVQKCRSKPLSV